VQTSVTKKQMITNATLVGKFFSPPSSSITRLRSHNLKSPRGRGDYLEVFFVSRIETQNIKHFGKFWNQTSLRLRSKIWKIHENSARRLNKLVSWTLAKALCYQNDLDEVSTLSLILMFQPFQRAKAGAMLGMS